jgi:hypothetical protein
MEPNQTSAINLPIVRLSNEYFLASSKARNAKPTAHAATPGLVSSNAPMAILKPTPSLPSKFYDLTKKDKDYVFYFKI